MPELNPTADRQPIMKKTRLPRFARVKNPPRMFLTERDMEILCQVYTFRLMTREQIEGLLFPPNNGQDHPTKTSKARRRLQLLYQNGYLDRIAAPVGHGTWAWRPVYRLSRKGAALIAPQLGSVPSLLPYWGRGDDQDHRAPHPSLLFLDHTLKINDVRIAVIRAAAGSGYRVEEWLDESKLKSQEMRDYVTVTSEHSHNLRVAVIPDAYFVLNLGDRRARFFLELDQATVSNKRWKTRVRAYLSYIDSGKYQERYQTRSLRILTVTTTPKRMTNLKATTEKANGNDVFWFTTFEQATAENILFSPMWLSATDETGRSRKPLIS